MNLERGAADVLIKAASIPIEENNHIARGDGQAKMPKRREDASHSQSFAKRN